MSCRPLPVTAERPSSPRNEHSELCLDLSSSAFPPFREDDREVFTIDLAVVIDISLALGSPTLEQGGEVGAIDEFVVIEIADA